MLNRFRLGEKLPKGVQLLYFDVVFAHGLQIIMILFLSFMVVAKR